ncbi:hypothetical protein CANARDRAFT_174881 [[Candida] arabinofermentans NRRL YB-2248]|uniref:Increased recombination centers protein 22 n=1 Tax=[Candida] arabinofermentans NRRL YB-2248 TaxID=983967 RepID=A0A1E4T540_9ASCO|nr:hypothetical protein CANARDRAFT_174881 [[Candida] arabinofermentans NRRL YB-2248]
MSDLGKPSGAMSGVSKSTPLSLVIALSKDISLNLDEPVSDPSRRTFVPTEEKPFNFRIEYLIKDKQSVSSELVPVTNGDTLSLEYEFTNGELEDCTIVGVGGQLISPVSGEVLYNVTATNVGPLSVAQDESINFIQKIGIDLIPESYLIVPAIYIVYADQLMVLGSRNQLITVEDPQISIFNPKLLVLEVLLGGSLGYIVYLLYQTFGASYFAPAKKESKAKATTTKTASASKTTGSKTYDSSWLPETHLKTAKKTKKTI